jgi:hypothetical protein
MAVRATERAARRKAAEPEPEAGHPDGTREHHQHVDGCMLICSCGDPGTIGVFSFVPEWPEDPAEMARISRENADFLAWLECRYCGKRGVQAGDTFGTWPPESLTPGSGD